MRPALPLFAIAALVAGPVAAAAVDVTINGTVVPKATSAIDFTQDLIDFREGGDPNPQVLPGAKHYAVCIAAPAPIALLDAELPRADTATRMTVQIEDGRTFARCLLASLKTEGGGAKRRLTYCLRCEDVTTP